MKIRSKQMKIKDIRYDHINEIEAGLGFQQQNMPVYVVSILHDLSLNQINHNEDNFVDMTVKDFLEYSQFLIQAANEAHDRNAEIGFEKSEWFDFDNEGDVLRHHPYTAILRNSSGKQLSFSEYRLQHTTDY